MSLQITGGREGTTFAVHVSPRGRKSEVLGIHGDALKVRVAAPPVEGAANEELVRFLAEVLGVSRGSVKVVSGHTSRRKMVSAAGVAPEVVLRQLLGEEA